MEETISRYFQTLKQQSKVKYVLVMAAIVLASLGFVAVVVLITDDKTSLLSDIFASFIGFAFLFVSALLVTWRLHKKEDQIKVSYRNQDMWNHYVKEYRHIIDLHDSQAVVYFDPLLQMNKYHSKHIRVEDDPTAFFQLDSFIKSHCGTLLEAHSSSKTLDSVTVRLADFEPATEANGQTATIHCMRSSYMAHLLTNRALDYLIEGSLSIRKLYENDAKLRPLRRSMLSNHFGVNALIFLRNGEKEDGWLLMPHRRNDATVAKNSVTASMATRLKMEKHYFANEYADRMTADYMEHVYVEDNVAGAMWVTADWLKAHPARVDFLGLSRDIYEGGKPTLFYAVYVDADPEAYLQGRAEWDEKEKQKRETRKRETSAYRLGFPQFSIDEMDRIHIADWTTVRMQTVWAGHPRRAIMPEMDYHDTRLDDAKLTFVDYNGRAYAYAFEQNMIANFLFLQEYEKQEA